MWEDLLRQQSEGSLSTFIVNCCYHISSWKSRFGESTWRYVFYNSEIKAEKNRLKKKTDWNVSKLGGRFLNGIAVSNEILLNSQILSACARCCNESQLWTGILHSSPSLLTPLLPPSYIARHCITIVWHCIIIVSHCITLQEQLFAKSRSTFPI